MKAFLQSMNQILSIGRQPNDPTLALHKARQGRKRCFALGSAGMGHLFCLWKAAVFLPIPTDSSFIVSDIL
jgi:hypothetical protein